MSRSVPVLPTRRRRTDWWVYGLAGTTVGLFALALVVRLECTPYHCVGSSAERVLNLDEVGGLPRLFTTGLFLATAVVALRGGRRAAGTRRTWWLLIALVGLCLTVAKVLSAHSLAKTADPVVTFLIGLLLAAATLTVVRVTARRWDVPAGTPVAVALGLYAVAALGLDLLTAWAAALTGSVQPVAVAVATFVEEIAEALAALLLLATVHREVVQEEGDELGARCSAPAVDGGSPDH
jgi:hypothetical protein